jgi:tetratricopeptide (TPR) repeat protein
MRIDLTRLAPLALAAAAVVSAPTAGVAAVNDDCRSNDRVRVISGCTVQLSAKQQSKADRAEAFWRRAGVFITLNQLAAAEADLERASGLAPGNANVLVNRGRLHLARGDAALAVKSLNAALELDPNNPFGLGLRAEAHVRLARYAEAGADTRKALSINPTFTYALAISGWSNRLQGQLDEAISDLDRAVAISPAYTFALLLRGDAWQAKNDLARAIADYQAVLRVQPTHRIAVARLNAAVALQTTVRPPNRSPVVKAEAVPAPGAFPGTQAPGSRADLPLSVPPSGTLE